MFQRARYAQQKVPNAFWGLLFGIPLINTVLFYGIYVVIYKSNPALHWNNPFYYLSMFFFGFLNICLWQKLHKLKRENYKAAKRWESLYPNLLGVGLFIYAFLYI